MKTTDRRRFLRASLSGVAGLASAPLLSGLAGCQHAPAQPSPVPSVAIATRKLTDRITLISGVPGNVLALDSGDGVVLVDSGDANSARAVKASLGGARVRTLFNTH